MPRGELCVLVGSHSINQTGAGLVTWHVCQPACSTSRGRQTGCNSIVSPPTQRVTLIICNMATHFNVWFWRMHAADLPWEHS
jgi:hypothetical protein